MDPTTPGRPLSTVSTTENVSSTPTASGNSRLMPTLSKLSMSNSRPSVLLPNSEAEPTSYTAKTARIVSKGSKEIFRRSGLSGLFGESAPPAGPSGTSKNRSTLDVSTILYPTLRSHSSPAPYPILVLSLSQIDSISPIITNDELFDVLLRRLEPWVGEEGEGGYVLVVLAADDKTDSERKWPGIGWFVWKWKRIPRKYRKNLKRLYIVHPSMFTRTLLPLVLPLISPKSYPKLQPLGSLISLATSYKVPLAGMDIPISVLREESRALRDQPSLYHRRSTRRYPVKDIETSSTWSDTVSSTFSYAASYLPFGRTISSDEKTSEAVEENRGYWGRTAVELVGGEAGGKVPIVFQQLGKAILEECTTTEGIFRRTSNSLLVEPITAILDLPIHDQPSLPWRDVAIEDPLTLPKILLRLLADMQEPLILSSSYPAIRKATTLELVQSFLPTLPNSHRLILDFVISLLRQVSQFEDQTKMSPLALSIVLAPSLINGPDPIADTEMCLQPGKSLPLALRGSERDPSAGNGTLVGMLEILIQQPNT